jgi:signal transduction histidine kinase/ligand-binding sensor domain-containing protein/CheY-like chemotaxis protein
MKKRLFFLLFVLPFSSNLAQIRQTLFDQIPLDQELTSGVVLNITQDSLGFIWIGTFEGLVRYDGYDFKRIPSGGNSEYAISSDRTYHLNEGQNQKLWIGTWEGLNCMDLKTGKVERFTQISEKSKQNINKLVNYVFEDKQARIWISYPNGLHRFDKVNKKAIRVTQENSIGWTYRDRDVTAICESKNGKLWAGGAAGILKINPNQNTYQRIFIRKDTFNADSQRVRKIFFSENQTMWIGTLQGLLKSTDEGYSFHKIKLPIEALNQANLQAITEDSEGYLWLGFAQNGLLRWHPLTGVFQHFLYSYINTNSLISNNIINLFKDKSNNIWIGTNKGVNKINNQVQKFQFYQNDPELRQEDAENTIARAYFDPENGLWASNASHTFQNNVLGQPFKRNQDLKDSLFLEYFHKDKQGKLWIAAMQVAGKASTGGLFYYDKIKKRIIRAKGDKRTIYSRMYDVKTDLQNPDWLWLASVNGFCHYNKITFDTAWFYPQEQHRDVGNSTQRFCQTEGGHIWFASAGNGLGHFNINTKQFEFLRHDSNNPNSIIGDFVRNIVEGGKDTIWIATNTGLSCYSIRSKSFTNFNLDNGLKGGNLIYDVGIDKKGQVWFTTNQYLSSYNPQDKSFNYYNRAHGFATNFNRASIFVTENGQFFIGGTNGLIVFNPSEITKYKIIPKIVLTEFRLKNQINFLPETPENTKRILLNYSDNVFSFQFAALEFINNKNIDYAYKMEGFDKEWIFSGKERKATYTNLSAGKYYFLVKSTNFDGIWASEPSLRIEIIISPPFWQTRWFIVLMTLIAGTFLYMIFHVIKQQQRLKHQKEIAEQSAHYKSQFLANMSHEIRTPMNAIFGLSRLLSEMNLDKKAKEYVEVIKNSSENLVRIINDILDYSKIESGKFIFVHRPFELNILLNQIKNTLQHKVEEKDLTFKINVSDDVPNLLKGDAPRLNQILINLIGNAIKFTEKGYIEVIIKKQEDINAQQVCLSFSIKDTGIGIAPEFLPRIFESFEQGDEEVFSRFGGTGLGLSITKQLIEQQGGTLNVDSELEKGTTFSFVLPFEISQSSVLPETQNTIRQDFSGIRILIVDDTFFNQMLATELLKKYIPNVKIDVADNGQIALEKVREKVFDIILMDVKMPVMGGYEATQLIRKMPAPICDTPIIALTANAVEAQLEECKKIGMNDAIPKPIDSNILLQKLKEYVKLEHSPRTDEV